MEQLSQPYAWKARDVFGVIVTTTPPQLLAMIQAFFNNTLHIDDDFLVKKIISEKEREREGAISMGLP